MFSALLLSASLSLAGDCGDCAGGRQGLFARRAERKAARSSCASTAEMVTETQQPAVITTRTVQPVKTITGPAKKTTTITPTGAAQAVPPKASK
jgi:hypothetical protein